MAFHEVASNNRGSILPIRMKSRLEASVIRNGMTDQPTPAGLADPQATFTPSTVADYHASSERLPATPVSEVERIESIDVLRGIAVMGILFVNIQYMALPFHTNENQHWRGLPPLDGIANLIVQVFFQLKFITLFSFLFGAGLAIMMERLERTGRPFVAVYVRRLLVLLAIGIFHGIFLWFGDILAVYAILGFAALLLRKSSPRTLLIVAAILFLLPIPAYLGFAALDPTADWTTPSWSAMAHELQSSMATTRAATSATASGPAIDSPTAAPSIVVRFLTFLDNETQVYQSGSFGEVLALRTFYFVFTGLFSLPFFYLWRCLSMFLAGIAAVRLGFFLTDRSRPARWGLTALLFATGLALEIYSDRFLGRDSRQAASLSRAIVLSYVGSLLLAASYARTIITLCSRSRMHRLFHPIAAVGRMALSNYLMHSILGGLLFYSHGLGLFGTVNYAGLFGISCGILAFQLVLSPLWLRHFQFGPVEWLWRTATYAKVQPMLRRSG